MVEINCSLIQTKTMLKILKQHFILTLQNRD